MTTKTLPLASLVEDLNLYPRHNLNDIHVADLVRALQAGVTLPMIIVDAQSKRIVDWFHRKRALLKHLGEEASVPVELRRYKTEADLFLDAVRLNAAHGAKFDRQDQRRIVIRATEMKIDHKAIAVTLSVPEQHVEYLAVQVFYDDGGATKPGKRGFSHLYGQTLTPQQMKVVDTVRSGEVVRLCVELRGLLDADLVDLTNDRILGELGSTSAAIARVLKARRKTA